MVAEKFQLHGVKMIYYILYILYIKYYICESKN